MMTSSRISEDVKQHGRFVAAILAEIAYLVGRTYIIDLFESRHEVEAALSLWRLIFVLLYLWIFYDTVANKSRRLPVPRHPLLITSLLIALATMPLAHVAFSFNWPSDLFELVAIPIAALREELFYRAVVQNALERFVHPLTAVLTTTLLFALSHIGAQPINLATLSSFFAVGVALGLIYHQTRNLWLVAVLHALGNFLVWIPHSVPNAGSIAFAANVAAVLAAVTWWQLNQDRRDRRERGMSA